MSLPESLLFTGTIAAVAVSAAVVSGPALVHTVAAQQVPRYPVPSAMFAPPVLPPPAPAAPVPAPQPALPPPVQPPSTPVVGPPALPTAPARPPVAPAPIPPPPTGTSVPPPEDPCDIGLVFDPILGVCVSI